MNAQGFDGLPRVVSEDEFNKAVENSSFIAQRTYVAPDQETLNEYRNMFYDGKWYVDCSTGGAQYGQGMYCAANYKGELTDGIMSEMKHYIKLGADRLNGKALTEQEKIELIEKSIKSFGNKEKQELAKVYVQVLAEVGNPDQDIVDKVLDILTDKETRYLDTIVNLVNNAYSTPAYIETFTLTSDAKIIKYDELRGMYNDWRQHGHESLIEKCFAECIGNNRDKGEDFVTALMFDLYSNEGMRDKLPFTYTDAMKSYDNLSSSDYSLIDKLTSKYGKMANDIKREFYKKSDMNIGAYATMLGYDAINAEGHGESGSYTVILNRTKVIIKGDN